MPELEIPIDKLEKFSSTEIEESEPLSPEEILAKEEKEKLEKLEKEKGEKEKLEKPSEEILPDLSLLSGAEPTLVKELEDILKKEEDNLEEDELKKIEDNLELVKAIANKDITLIGQLQGTEKYLESGEFEDNLEGYQSYLSERDKIRDKNVVSEFLQGTPELNALYDHLVINKYPLSTFLAQNNKPAILDTKIEKITESMSDDQKETITIVHEAIVRENLKANNIDSKTVDAIIGGAKSALTLENMAISSLANMNSLYDSQIESYHNKAAENLKLEQEKETSQLEEVKTLIKTGKLLENIAISKTDEANFIKYLSVPINEKGEKMADLNYSKLSLAEKTAIDYLVFKGFKLPIGVKTTLASKYRLSKAQNDKRKPTALGAGGSSKGGQKGLSLEEFARNAGAI